MFEGFLIKYVGSHYAHVLIGFIGLIGLFLVCKLFGLIPKELNLELLSAKIKATFIKEPETQKWFIEPDKELSLSPNKGNTKIFKSMFPLKKLETEEFIYFAKSYLWRHEYLTKSDLDVFEKMMEGDESGVHPEKWEPYWNSQDRMDIDFRRIRKIVKKAKKAELEFQKQLEKF